MSFDSAESHQTDSELETGKGNRAAAARKLGISRSTLFLWLDELGITDGR